MDKRFESMERRFDGMENRLDHMDKRFDRLEKKMGGIRVDLTETHVLSKTAQHEKKLRQLSEQYQ